MPRTFYVTAALIAAICMSVESIAQVTDCSIRRRVVAKVWRVSESGDIFDLVEEGFVNRELGDFSFTAEAIVDGAGSSASHSMNWVIGDSVVEAIGNHALGISQSEEGVLRWFSASVMVDGSFTTTSDSEFSYSGVALGGEVHVLQIEREDGFALEKHFPVNGGDFEYISPVLEPGEYEFFFAIVDDHNGSDAFSRDAICDFRVGITPIDGLAEKSKAWGLVKALYY